MLLMHHISSARGGVRFEHGAAEETADIPLFISARRRGLRSEPRAGRHSAAKGRRCDFDIEYRRLHILLQR